MKVIKPLLVGFSGRPYKKQGNHYAATGFWAFPFATPDVPLSEQEMWRSLQPFLPLDAPWDEGVPKERGEVLLKGSCYASGGIPVPHRRVSLCVGSINKVLDVYGPRTWVRSQGFPKKGEPEPFVSLPLDYSHAFGGPGYAPNPLGIGFAEPNDGRPRPIPNIEDAIQPIISPEDRPEPAGYDALNLTWSGRNQKIGTYRPDELQAREPPPLPENTDWTFYNQAPPDQWLSGMWQGGEEFSLSGFRSDDPHQDGRLPRIRLRVFLTFLTGQTVEIEMRQETVWLFPEISVGVVIHRGSHPLTSDDTSEIRTLLVGAEDPQDNRSLEYYMKIQARRESRNKEDVSRFGDAPLLPERLSDDPRANLFDIEKQRQKLQEKRPRKLPKWAAKQFDQAKEHVAKKIQTFLATLSKPSADFPVDLVPLFEKELQEKMQQFDAIRQTFENPPPSFEEIQEMKKAALQKVEEARKKSFESMEKAISKMPPGSLEELGISREALIAHYRNQLLGNPTKTQAPKKKQKTLDEILDPEKIMASIQSQKEKIMAQGQKDPDAMLLLEVLTQPIDATRQTVTEKVEKMKSTIPPFNTAGLTRILHHFAPPDPNPEGSEELRHQVLEAIGRKEKFTDQDLRGADLSGLDLSGVDFSEADLIGANFSGSNLSQATFSGAWAAHANFSRCRLDHTDFSKASLGCSDLSESQGTGTSFAGAFLTGAVLIDVTLKSGDFSKADLFDITIRRSVLHQGQFSEAKLLRTPKLPYPHSKGLPFSPDDGGRLPMEDADFNGSRFVKAIFHKVDFVRMDFAQCTFEKTTFLECTGPGTRFDEATFKKVAFPKSTAFPQSSFVKTDLSESNLRGVNLEGSDFRGATLMKMDGSEGNFRSTNLSGVQAVKAQFLKADLKNADARGGNFKEALFLKADLRGVDFSHGSLYKAGFTGAQIDRSTLWDHALTGKTTLNQERSS